MRNESAAFVAVYFSAAWTYIDKYIFYGMDSIDVTQKFCEVGEAKKIKSFKAIIKNESS